MAPLHSLIPRNPKRERFSGRSPALASDERKREATLSKRAAASESKGDLGLATLYCGARNKM